MDLKNITSIILGIIVLGIISYSSLSFTRDGIIDSPEVVLKKWAVIVMIMIYFYFAYVGEIKEFKNIYYVAFVLIALPIIIMGNYTIAISSIKNEDERKKYVDVYDYDKKEFKSIYYEIFNYLGGFMVVVLVIIVVMLMNSRSSFYY